MQKEYVFMTLILRFACLSCLISTLSFAESLSGWLVNSKCFSSIERNRGDVPSYVNWDENGAIRYCSPTKKTKSFAIVRQNDGLPFKLDAAGNEKAIDLGLNDKKFAYLVKVEGVTRRRDGMVSWSTTTVQAFAVLRRVNAHGKDAPGL
jgi:hypothetical protein